MVSSKQKIESKSPQISVVMSAYNAERYLKPAIESILKQTFKDFEFIIIDDASRDQTWEIISKAASKDKRIIPLRNKKNLKLSQCLNLGISSAKGKYIARMDADDISVMDRLEKQFRYMESHDHVGIVGGVMEIMSAKGEIKSRRTYPLTDSEIRAKIFFYSPFSHPLVMFRKSVLDEVGYYLEEYNPAEDYELYFRIGQKAKFANLSDILLHYRIVPKSMTTGSTRHMEKQTIRIRNEYTAKDYKRSFLARLYNDLHLLSMYLLPPSIKIKLFNLFRNS